MEELLEPEVSGMKRVPTELELALRDLGQGQRIANDGNTGKSVQVPSNAEFFCAFSEVGASRLEIDGIASADSTLVVFKDQYVMFYPIGPGQGLSCYGPASSFCNIRFLGHINR
jgi:hypothetical protein